MKAQQRQMRKQLIEMICDAIHGSGIDDTWQITDTKHGIYAVNSFHCMDEHGFYCGWADFKVFWPHRKSYDNFRLMFSGRNAQHLNRKYQLREYLEQTIIDGPESAWGRGSALTDEQVAALREFRGY